MGLSHHYIGSWLTAGQALSPMIFHSLCLQSSRRYLQHSYVAFQAVKRSRKQPGEAWCALQAT